MARRCIFCDSKSGSREHILPDWLNRVFEGLPPPVDPDEQPRTARGVVDFQTGTHFQRSWGATEIASHVTRLVCHDCNTGWMSRLEGRSAPLLTPMIEGHPTTLSQDEQLIVATWATKTAMVLELAIDKPGHFSAEDCRLVMPPHDRPPGYLRIFAAAVEGLIRPWDAGALVAHVQGGGQDILVHIYTLQINMLVLQVIRPDPPPSVYGALNSIPTARGHEIPLFPPVDGFFWPPKESLSNETLNQYRARITSGAPPWGPGSPADPRS